MTGRDGIIDAVRRTLERRSEVLDAYVFGSIARGDARSDSDVDVAVYVDPGAPMPAFGHAATLGSELIGALERNDVDVVILNRADPLLYFRVLRDGVRIVSRDLAAATGREGRALSRYYDDLPRLELVRRLTEERIDAGTFGR